MRVWISCTVLGLGACVAGALAYGCGQGAFGTCAENGKCAPDGGGDATTSGEGGTAGHDGGGGGDATADAMEAGCSSPTTLACNGACADPTLPTSCGTCSNVCEGGTPLCSSGTCISTCMGSTPTDCNGSCVNEQSDPQHCGGCSTVCPGPDGGEGAAACDDGGCEIECEADGGTPSLCGSVCVNEQNDPNHCGGCSTVCPGLDGGVGAAVCQDGGCGYACSAEGGTPTSCGSLCVDTSTDPNHCGGCMTVCPAVANGSPACVLPSGDGGTPTCGATACTTGYHLAGTGCQTLCSANTDDPTTDPCVVADAYGTFVAPSGSDAAGCGTKASPCATIGNAMSVAAALTKRVYACGTFMTTQTVTSAGDGVTVYGGFSCLTWAYNVNMPTMVQPTTTPTAMAPGYALQVTGTTTGVTFQDFAFTAPGASQTPSATPASSVAVFANQSIVTLTRVAVTAGIGQPGAGGGQAFANWAGVNSYTGGNGTPLGGGGSAGGPNDCLDGVTKSTGGTGGTYNGTAANPGTATPTAGTLNGGSSSVGSCTGGTTSNGASGAAPMSQAAGSQAIGSLGTTGWAVGAGGADGSNGSPGQGGGGGGADDDPTDMIGGPGGGGGAGGCGGGMGYGGHSGGASIGILDYQSTLTLTTVTITTGTGGGGGSGSKGQDGQAGANGGNGKGGCSGGAGGNGGGGSGGGGGAGGPSVGIVWQGTAPVINGAPVPSATAATGVTLGITLGGQGPGASGGNGGGGGGNSGAGGGQGATLDPPMAVLQSP